MPQEAGIGALESCKVSVDGSVTVRGTVPFDVAGDYINGKIAILQFRRGRTIRNMGGTVCAEIKMTTRFSVTVAHRRFPGICHRYAAAVIYDGTTYKSVLLCIYRIRLYLDLALQKPYRTN